MGGLKDFSAECAYSKLHQPHTQYLIKLFSPADELKWLTKNKDVVT